MPSGPDGFVQVQLRNLDLESVSTTFKSNGSCKRTRLTSFIIRSKQSWQTSLNWCYGCTTFKNLKAAKTKAEHRSSEWSLSPHGIIHFQLTCKQIPSFEYFRILYFHGDWHDFHMEYDRRRNACQGSHPVTLSNTSPSASVAGNIRQYGDLPLWESHVGFEHFFTREKNCSLRNEGYSTHPSGGCCQADI